MLPEARLARQPADAIAAELRPLLGTDKDRRW